MALPEHQEQLLREAIAEYGSEAEARRWVATPETSAHVSGDAVDIGPSEAAAWLSGHGARYGLCQIYGNEPWHYELRPEAGRVRVPRDVRRPDTRSEDAAVKNMRSDLRSLAALAVVVLAGAGCGEGARRDRRRRGSDRLRDGDRFRGRARRGAIRRKA